MRVVLVDDSKSAIFALESSLLDIRGIDVVSFTVPGDALDYCLENIADLIIIDYVMPVHTGIDIIKRLKQSEDYRLVPMIMVTAERDREILIEAIEAGATDFINKPFDAIELQARVLNLLELRRAHVELAQQATRLSDEIARATAELVDREEEIIWRLARAIEFRDGATGDHISRVAQISRLIAEDLGLDKDHCRMIYLAAPLHDVGKIGIADDILLKPGKLTPEEIRQMQMHVEYGVGILGNGTSRLLQVAEAIAAGHHEEWDGTGYPKALSGSAIPLEARIVAIADVFEALCTERPYKQAWPINEARQYILDQSGRHFDPRCVSAFERRWPQIAALMDRKEATGPVPPLMATADDYASLAAKTSHEIEELRTSQ